MKLKLTDLQIDALKEANNIGTGHAAIALSHIIGKKIMIAVTRSDIIPSDDYLANITKNNKNEAVGIYFETLGDMRGAVFFLFDKNSSLKLSDILLSRKHEETKFIDERAQAALKEACNIIAGAFFTVLSDMLKINVFHKNPSFAYDSPDLIMYSVCEQIFGNRDQRMCFSTEFIESSLQITGCFAYIPRDESMEIILKKLERK